MKKNEWKNLGCYRMLVDRIGCMTRDRSGFCCM